MTQNTLSDDVNKKVSISIVLYKTPEDHLLRCLESLNSVLIQTKIYLIDNSPEDTLSDTFSDFPNLIYMHLPDNPGYGKAHNFAIYESLQSNVDYHLVLNADVYFDEDVITPMVSYMSKNPEVGLMMPKVLNPDGTIQRLCKLVPSPVDLILRRFFSTKAKRRRNSFFELHNSGYNSIMFVPYLSGCFMLLNTKAIENIGLFDERFFMYPEDIDLTRRIALQYETLFFPEVSIYHLHAAESSKSYRILIIHIYNIIKYFNKWGWFYDPIRIQLNKKTLGQFDL